MGGVEGLIQLVRNNISVAIFFSSFLFADNNFSELVAQLRTEKTELKEKLDETEEELKVQ